MVNIYNSLLKFISGRCLLTASKSCVPQPCQLPSPTHSLDNTCCVQVQRKFRFVFPIYLSLPYQPLRFLLVYKGCWEDFRSRIWCLDISFAPCICGHTRCLPSPSCSACLWDGSAASRIQGLRIQVSACWFWSVTNFWMWDLSFGRKRLLMESKSNVEK